MIMAKIDELVSILIYHGMGLHYILIMEEYIYLSIICSYYLVVI